MMSGQRLPTDPPETMAKRNESAGPATLYTTSAILLFICVFLFQAVAIFKLTQEVNLLKEIQTVAMLKIDSLTQEVSSLKDILDETQLESQSKVQSKVNPSEEAMAVTANPVTCEMTTDTVSSAKTMEPSTTTLMTNTTAETTTNADIVATKHAAPVESSRTCPTTPTVGYANLLWKRQGTIIVGDSTRDNLGYSVKISSEGMTLVVGAPGYYFFGDRPGYVKVYDKGASASTWNHDQTLSGDTNGDRFGNSVAISLDGSTIAVGAHGSWEKNDRPGYVKIYRRESNVSAGSSWRQVGQTIYGEANGDHSGHSVSLSENGDTVAIGAYANDGNGSASGHVRVFSLNGSSWQQLGRDINGEASGDNSGWSTSLSSDGKTVAIGAPFNDGNGNKSGHVRVYYLDEEGSSLSWKQLGQDIDAESSHDWFGSSVSFASDSKTLAIGASGPGSSTEPTGYTKVYYFDDDYHLWKQLGQTIIGEANKDYSGMSVSLSASGCLLAIGAYANDIGANANAPMANDGNGAGSGHVRVFKLEGSSWIQLGQDIIEGESAGDGSPDVSLASDGNTVAIGSHWSDENGDKSGSVMVFNIDY